MPDGEWISARKLLGLLRKHRREWPCPEIPIRTPLSAGFISARAKKAELEVRGSRGGVVVKENWDVPPKVWKGSSENSVLNLSTGYYSSRAYGSGYRSVKCYGLSFKLAEVRDELEIEDDGTIPLLDADQFAASHESSIDQALRECSSDDWWSYPEAVAWVMSSNIRDVATARAWLRYHEGNGRAIEGGKLAAFLGTQAAEDAMELLANSAGGSGERSVRVQGWDCNGKLSPIPASDWSGCKVHLVSGLGVLAPVNDHRFARCRDLLINREDLQLAFPALDKVRDAPPSSAAARGNVRQERVEEWFRTTRCPQFGDTVAPNWKSCWGAAKVHFKSKNVTKDILLAARRNAAPPHWQRTGRNRSG
jgi:hypothetical protein